MSARKSLFIAYVLWLFLGLLGVHRFYIGNFGMGLFFLVTFFLSFGIIPFILWVIDFFRYVSAEIILSMIRMPGLVRRANRRIAERKGKAFVFQPVAQ